MSHELRRSSIFIGLLDTQKSATTPLSSYASLDLWSLRILGHMILQGCGFISDDMRDEWKNEGRIWTGICWGEKNRQKTSSERILIKKIKCIPTWLDILIPLCSINIWLPSLHHPSIHPFIQLLINLCISGQTLSMHIKIFAKLTWLASARHSLLIVSTATTI